MRLPFPNIWPSLDDQSTEYTAESIFLILGLTGSGKSTFINAAAEGGTDGAIPVGHGLESTTQHVCTAVISDPACASKKTILVEAPAFNYEMASIRASERQLLKWIDDPVPTKKRKIAGIIYLGKISEPRMTISPFVHLEIFEQLLGKQFTTKIHLVTTMWDRTPRGKAERREEELKASQWRPLIATGARYNRFDGTRASALGIITDMLADAAQPRGQSSTVDVPQSLRSRILSLFKGTGRKPYRTSSLLHDSDDIYVAVIGLSGSGKSSFINAASGRLERAVGHGLEPCTKEIGTVEVSCPLKCDGRIIFIDTPGWDDQNCSDPGGIKAMAQRLSTRNGKSVLAGVIYLHRIANNRSSQNTLEEIVKSIYGSHLCGKGVRPSPIIATTMWADVEDEIGDRRHQALEQLLKSTIIRHSDDYDSAWKVLDNLVRAANDAFAIRFRLGLKKLVVHLRSSDPLSTVAGRVQVLGQKLEELVVNLRNQDISKEEVGQHASDYESARKELSTILEALQKEDPGHTIDENLWKRARSQIQVDLL